ncbi:MAG: HAD family hydrolase [Myxococcota bacterium]
MLRIRAFLFDFDGLLVDTEPLHCEGFRTVANSRGVALTEDEYFAHFIGYDDRDALAGMWERVGRPRPSPAELDALVSEKAEVLARLMAQSLEPRPGAPDFVARAAAMAHAGVCSGALRHEVELGLETTGIAHHMQAIVPAEDVARGKPHPEGYEKLMRLLSEQATRAGERPLEPGECVVLEDTSRGIQAGAAAGCHTIGVVGTETREALEEHADLVRDSLEGLDPSDLPHLLDGGTSGGA